MILTIYQSIDVPDGGTDGSAAGDPVEKMRREVKTQIEYDILAEEENGGMLNEIVNIMVKFVAISF